MMSNDDVVKRFGLTATTGNPPTDEQKSAVTDIRELAVNLALAINAGVPEGRNKSIAFTHLEDVIMRANRGIFQDGE